MITEKPNITYIENLAAGSKDFKQQLIDIMKKEFPQERTVFIHNYKSNKLLDAADNVHKLKHKIGMFGFEDGYQVAVDFENELKGEKNSLYSEFMLILDAIEDFLKTL